MQENNPEMKNKRLFPPSDAKDIAVGENEKIRSNVNENHKTSSSPNNSFKQRRKTTPTNLLLTAPKPFKSLTNTYESNNHRKPNMNNMRMDCADSGGYNQLINKNCVSSSTLPSNSRYQHGNDKFFAMQEGSDGNGKEAKQASPQESSSPTSEPPPILPRRYG